jgi:Flp pilus assembly secretin CpaC
LGLTVCLLTAACQTRLGHDGESGNALAISEPANATLHKLKETGIPEMAFFAPATLSEAIDFLRQVSRSRDPSGGPSDKRGVTLELRLPAVHNDHDVKSRGPVIPALSLRAVTLYDALKALCESVGMKFRVLGDDGRVVIVPDYDDEDWATCSFNIPPALADRLFSRLDGQVPSSDPNQIWHDFFEQLGVTGPEFASFEYLPGIGKLRVTNTPENLALIEMAFEQFALRMIEVEMQIHAFRTKDIERLRLSGGVSVDTLMALRRQGKSRLVATATALTQSGQEALVKAVREVLYPTEFLFEGGQTSNVTARSSAGALMPGYFETREVGMVLQVVPEITRNGAWINLLLNPKWVTLEGWNSWPAGITTGRKHRTLPLRHPVFGVTSFETTVTVTEGGTVLLGCCSTPDGEWVQAGFLTVLPQGKSPEIARGMLGSEKRADPNAAAIKQRMQNIVIPEMTFRPPFTLVDAIAFFAKASRDYDDPKIPESQRGLSFALKLPLAVAKPPDTDNNVNPFAPLDLPSTTNGVPIISALSARFVSLYDALKLICDVTGMKLRIRDGVIWIEPMELPDGELISRLYPIQDPIDGFRMDDTGSKQHQNWEPFFEALGVRWPSGSSIAYLVNIGRLRVTNTRENLDVFEQVLSDLMIRPLMVEVEMQIHAFRPADIETLRLSGDVSVASLTALRQQGRSKPVASALVLTRSGQEAVMKSVREVTYPTELDVDSSQTGSNGTLWDGTKALTPCNYEMRDVGMLLQVMPEVSAENYSQILLILNPQWITLDRWETYPAELAAGRTSKTLPLRQPVFGVTRFQTQIEVKDGQTVLLGSSSTPDGKWVHVGFLTVRRVDPQAEHRPQ